MRRRDADDAGEHVLRHRDAGQLLRARDAAGDLPLDEVRLGEEVGEEAEAGDDRGDAEVGRLVARANSTSSTSPGSRARRRRPARVSGWPRPRSSVPASACVLSRVSWPARPSSRLERISSPGATSAIGSRSGCQRLCIRAAPATRVGRRAARGRSSSSLQCPRRAELVQRDDRREPAVDEDRRHDLRGEPAVGLEHPLERRVVEGARGVSSWTTCSPCCELAHDRLGRAGRPCARRAATRRRRRAPRA